MRRPERIEILLTLSRKGAIEDWIPVTLRDLARELSTSPQTILRTLQELEEEGLIERKGGKRTVLRITEGGMEFLESTCRALEEVLYRGLIVGRVVSGLGEGAYYVRVYRDRIREYLGFDPYPGTLNLKVVFPRSIFDALYRAKPILIPGFVRDGRTFGDVRAYRVRVEGIEGAIVMPSRTVHPPQIAEVIAPVSLREALGLKDGDEVKVRVEE